MRKLFFLICVLVFALPVFAQDATPEMTTAPESAPWTCPDGYQGQTLSVFNWSTYVAEDTISNFEKACGVSVTYDVYESNEALLARLRGGNPGYDIIVPTDYMISIMIDEGLLEPIDLSLIPNFANISPNLQDPPYDPGNQYSVPYQWGTIGIGYNQTKVGAEITSWDQVFNYDGPVAWLEDLRGMMGIALNILGYDPNTEDPAEIEAAKQFLMDNGKNVVAIAQDDGQAMLERGDVDITIEYSGDIFQVMDSCDCNDFAFSIPDEGTIVWVDNLAIPVDAPNKALAEVFIDYILDPHAAADISNYTAYASPNQAAIDQGLIDPDLLSNRGIYPSAATMDRLFFVQPVPNAENNYNDAWDEIKVSLGK